MLPTTSATATESRPIRALHLEDEMADVELIHSLLEFEGLKCKWHRARGRAEFEAALAQGEFDLILADYRLPDFNGDSALELAQKAHPDTPFIFVSGAIGEEKAIELMRAGATDYVLKTRLIRLAPAIRRALRESQERDDRRQAEASLLAEREWLSVTLASIGDAVIATDVQGRINYLNAVAQELTGWTNEEAAGREVAEVFNIINEASREPVESPVTKVLREGVSAGLANHTLLIRRDGVELPIDDSGAPIRDGAGKIVGVVLVFRDIAEQRKTQRAADIANQRTARLQAVTAAFSRALSSREVAQVVVDHGLAALGASAGAVALQVAPGDMEILSAVGYAPEHLEDWRRFDPADPSPLAEVARTAQPLWRGTAQALTRQVPLASTAAGAQARAAVPLVIDSRVLGAMILSFTTPQDFKPEDKAFILALADQCAQALERTRLYEAEQRARAQATFLAEASRLLVASLNYSSMLEDLARMAVPDAADYCNVYLLDEAGEVLAAAIAHVDPAKEMLLRKIDSLYRPSLDNPNSWLGQAMRTGQPVMVAEVPTQVADTLPPEGDLRRLVGELGPRSVVVVPIAARGRMVGALLFAYSESGRRYGQDELALAEELARRVGVAMDNLRLYTEAQQLNAHLEERVVKRTEQLRIALDRGQAANRQLEREIQERRQAERQIRASERMLAEAQEIAQLGSWHWNVASNVITWSEELHRIYGLDPATFSATFEGFLNSVHPDDRGSVQNAIAQAMNDRGPFFFDHRIVRPDGTVRVLNARGDVTMDEATGQVVALSGTGQDVTDRKQIEEELRASQVQLRQLSDHMHEAREVERKRIAREIHDELGGALTGLKMDVVAIRRNLGPHDELVQERTNAMVGAIDDMIHAIRRIATELRPAILDDFGLMAALEWQLEDFEARSGIHCHITMPDGDVTLDPAAATAVFRVFQETLTNVARHAEATQVDVMLEDRSDYLLLQVRDNGRGIRQQDPRTARSVGILGMHERVRALAGELDIQGEPGNGTTVIVKIPLTRQGPVPATAGLVDAVG